MEVAKAFLRTIVRTFYTTEYVLVIDALALHSTLPDKDLAFVLGMQPKHLRRLLGKLAEDGMVSKQVRGERREGSTKMVTAKDGTQQMKERLTNVEWFYINFHRAIDSVKYRLWKLRSHVEAMGAPTTEKKDLACPRCKSSYTELEVMDSLDSQGNFLCHRCKHILDLVEDNGAASENEAMKRLNTQLAEILLLLQKIDATDVPENDFDTALRYAIPIKRSIHDPGANIQTVDLPKPILASSKGLALTQEKVSVVVSQDGAKETDRAELQLRREKEAKQNALPAWITSSTIDGAITSEGAREVARQAERDKHMGALTNLDDQKDAKDSKELQDKAIMDAYYDEMERLKAEQADLAATKSDDDESDDDDDENDFEDVLVEQTGSNGGAEQGIKTQDTSGQVSSNATDDERDTKRAKLQTGQANGQPSVNVEHVGKAAADSDEDEDDFEDV